MTKGDAVRRMDDMAFAVFRCACGMEMGQPCDPDDIPMYRPCNLPEVEWPGFGTTPAGCGGSMFRVRVYPPLNTWPRLYRWWYKARRWFILRRARRLNRKKLCASQDSP